MYFSIEVVLALKDVISYRTPYLEDLRKIAKIRNVSLSTITGEIIENYLNEHNNIIRYDLIRDGKKFISSAFQNLDPTVFEKIATIGAKEYARGAKKSINNFSLPNLLVYFRKWIEINKFTLSEFDEGERLRWILETNMGKNYNEISANIFKKALEKFGYSSNIESFTDEDYELVFLKKKIK